MMMSVKQEIRKRNTIFSCFSSLLGIPYSELGGQNRL